MRSEGEGLAALSLALTARHVIIDQNAYLGARVGLGVAIGVALVAMVGACVVMGPRGYRLPGTGAAL